jgi:sugar phosphate isomerase/epimerase
MLGRPNAQKEALSTQTVDREASLLAMRDTVRHLADFAKARGMDLLLENNVLAPGPLLPDGTSPLLMVTPEDLPAFFAEADRDNLGLLLDTGHAKVSAHTLGFSLAHFLEAATPHLGAFHLSDNDGTADTNERFDDDAWFAPYLRDHAATETVIEVYRIGPEGIREQKDRLERIRTRA